MKLLRHLISLILLFCFTLAGLAQVGYRNSSNALYWKNRKPFEGYWQQDVHYKIQANINETTDIIDASLRLTYYNNSPDTLHHLFFNLYQNAFQPGSYFDDLQRHNNIVPKYGLYELSGLGTKVDYVKVNGLIQKIEIDNTVMKVFLSREMLPNSSIEIEIPFHTYYDSGGNVRRRMKKFDASGFKHYDGVQWYPRLCVYDKKFGWSTDQHLNHEFYGNFGEFEVDLTFANDYIVEATGILINEKEALPDSIRKKIDIKNFANKPFGEKSSVVIARDSTRKTWKFRAINVHDFAFTADPTYRIGEVVWNGIRCISLAQEPSAAKWQNAADYAAKVIQTYSEDFGMYAWPKIIVADARDGMEYPMITLDGGSDPGYRGLLAHEIGHMWFFGMVANNETYRAALDEGLTQFLTAWSTKKIDGEYGVKEKKSSAYVNKFTYRFTEKDRHIGNYIEDACTEDDPSLNTHSDQFNGGVAHGGGYRHVYNKTSTMLYNLQYVLGDSLFLNSMKYYFNKWKMCHPYMEDFRQSFIEYTKADLNWFFDQWLETSKNIDYSIKTVKKTKIEDEYEIVFKRNGRMQMPIDFTVYAKDEKAYSFYIPNTWFEKKTDATVLPRWIGWDNLQPEYHAKVIVPGGIQNIVIDTTHRLADVNKLNNAYIFPVKFQFDGEINNPYDWKAYEMKARPDLWYNYYDGLKIGFNLSGDYLNKFHVFDFTFWVNSSLGQTYVPSPYALHNDQVSFNFDYSTSTYRFVKNSRFLFNLKNLDGLSGLQFGMDRKSSNSRNRGYFFFKTMHRETGSDMIYLLYPNEWQNNRYNNSTTVGGEHNYGRRKTNGKLHLYMRASTIGGDYNYANLNFTNINNTRIGKLDFASRIFLQWGFGNDTPHESALYLAGASPEELMDNKYTRSRGFIDNSFLGYGAETNHFQAGGGLNLRGYAGYVVVEEMANGEARAIYKGNSGGSVSAELGFDRLFGFKPKAFRQYARLQTYLFADAGVININKGNEDLLLSYPRVDAGAGLAFTIKKFGPMETLKPLTVRFDMPLFLNRIPYQNSDYFQFRWLIAINRSF